MKFTVTVTRRSTYEVEAESYDRAEGIALGALGRKRQEAALVDEETLGVEVEQDCDVVQVVFGKSAVAKRYAYAVPEGVDYAIGDQLVVPGLSGWPQVVEIVATGRGDYRGPLKSVLGKVTPPDPDFDEAPFGLCPDCGIPLPSAESRPCGGMMS